jgi:hypothetical protein
MTTGAARCRALRQAPTALTHTCVDWLCTLQTWSSLCVLAFVSMVRLPLADACRFQPCSVFAVCCVGHAGVVQVQLLPVSKIAVANLGPDWLTIYQGPALSTNWTDLRAGCKYQLRVSARNAVGCSQFSVPVACVTLPDAPLTPPRPSALLDTRVSTEHTAAAAISHWRLCWHTVCTHGPARLVRVAITSCWGIDHLLR